MENLQIKRDKIPELQKCDVSKACAVYMHYFCVCVINIYAYRYVFMHLVEISVRAEFHLLIGNPSVFRLWAE